MDFGGFFRGSLKPERFPIIFINKYLTQFIPGKQEGYGTTTESLPVFDPLTRTGDRQRDHSYL
jgi:hypothetical protein